MGSVRNLRLEKHAVILTGSISLSCSRFVTFAVQLTYSPSPRVLAQVLIERLATD
jgi:hypothetical protein